MQYFSNIFRSKNHYMERKKYLVNRLFRVSNNTIGSKIHKTILFFNRRILVFRRTVHD